MLDSFVSGPGEEGSDGLTGSAKMGKDRGKHVGCRALVASQDLRPKQWLWVCTVLVLRRKSIRGV